MTPEKAEKGLIFLLEHLKQQDAHWLNMMAELAALRACVSLYPDVQSRYEKALQEEGAKIAPSLASVASTYDAIILDLKASGPWDN